jgi:hypothetical protein
MLDKRCLIHALLLVPGAGWALVGSGCSSSRVTRVCDIMCDCTGCNEAGYTDCIDEAEAAQKLSADKSCGGSFDAYLTCLEDEIECRNDQFSYDGCEEEEAPLRECGISVFRTACELANEHQANECMLGPFTPDPSQCTGTLACQAKCNLETSCAGLFGQDFEESQRFSECLGRC